MREAENTARREAVAFTRAAEARSYTLVEASGMLGVGVETLREWRQRSEGGRLLPFLLGRPGYECDSLTVREIRSLAWMIGPGVSAAFVAENMPWVPRAIVEEVVGAYRREMERGRLASMTTLEWTMAGRVWSIDWTDPDAVIDGKYKKVLVVRDLGAGEILASLPAEGQSAELARELLEHLFIIHEAPLVMKSDNGSDLLASKEVSRLLEDFGVVPLLSPPYYPKYNGAVEAGIGSLKTHAFYEAARHGRLGYWTADDVEAGRMKANETSRPWGYGGPSPDRKWAERSVIGCDEWDRFREVWSAEHARWVVAGPKQARERAAQERMAVTRALVKCGYLVISKREVLKKAINA
jgi:transposase InsO family protein